MKNKYSAILLGLWSLILFSAPSVRAFSGEAPNLTLTTYNVGLAYNFVPFAVERKPLLIKALTESQSLAENESDVLCLQEVWSEQDQSDFDTALKGRYPYSYYVSPRQKYTDKSPACYMTDLIGRGKFGTCLALNCLLKKGDDFTDCAVNTCREEMNNLKSTNNQCAAAFFAQVGKNPLQAVLTVLNPFSKVGLFAYEGSAGVMLFSKHPLNKKSVIEFYDHSTSNRRAALYANIDFNNKKHHLVCAHLTADLSHFIPYTGQHNTWEEENLYQVNQIKTFIEKKAAGGRDPLYVIGDFNCSLPDNQVGIAGEFEKSCQSFLDSGYADPLINKGPECTYCAHNSLVDPKKTKDALIDHIFAKNLPAGTETETEVIFKDLMKPNMMNISDHFGVKHQFYLDQ